MGHGEQAGKLVGSRAVAVPELCPRQVSLGVLGMWTGRGGAGGMGRRGDGLGDITEAGTGASKLSYE